MRTHSAGTMHKKEAIALRLILASASPRRLDLLRQIGLTPDLVVPAVLDETPKRDELPAPYAKRLAREKAMAIAALHPGALILAADTVVACGRRILPKAETEAEARRCLDLLSGRRHRVLTAICLIAPGGALTERLVVTRVMLKTLNEAERRAYIVSGEWRGKAGGYAIQGRAQAFIPWLNGSYSNVVGLPLTETVALLAGAGYPAKP